MSRELWNEMPPKIQKKTHRKTRNARNHDIEMEKFSCLRRFHSGEINWILDHKNRHNRNCMNIYFLKMKADLIVLRRIKHPTGRSAHRPVISPDQGVLTLSEVTLHIVRSQEVD